MNESFSHNPQEEGPPSHPQPHFEAIPYPFDPPPGREKDCQQLCEMLSEFFAVNEFPADLQLAVNILVHFHAQMALTDGRELYPGDTSGLKCRRGSAARFEPPPPPEKVEDRITVSGDEPRVMRKVTTTRSPVLKSPHKKPATKAPPAVEGTTDKEEEPAKRGRKPILDDPFLREKLCVYLSVGLSRNVAAASLGISPATVTRTIKRDAEFRKQVLLAEVEYERNRSIMLLKAAKTSWRCAAWMYKNYHPHASTRRMRQKEKLMATAETVRQLSDALAAAEQRAAA